MERRQFMRDALKIAIGAGAAMTLLPKEETFAQSTDREQIDANKEAISLVAGAVIELNDQSIQRDNQIVQQSIGRDSQLLDAMNEERRIIGIAEMRVDPSGNLIPDPEFKPKLGGDSILPPQQSA